MMQHILKFMQLVLGSHCKDSMIIGMIWEVWHKRIKKLKTVNEIFKYNKTENGE